MISNERLKEIVADPAGARTEEVAALCAEIKVWRPVHDFLEETLKAIWINAKEEQNRSLVLDVITSAARSCIKRMKHAASGIGSSSD